jgi:arginyl-tRNA synthetase
MQQIIKSLLLTSLETCAKQHDFQIPQDFSIALESPRDTTHGDYSSNIAMILAKKIGMNPRQLAEHLIKNFPAHNYITSITCAGPGFINFILSPEYTIDCFESIWQSANNGVKPITENIKAIVDYSSPNLAKEMHIGHLRSTIIGDAIANILQFQGIDVIRQNHVGDWGTQFGMLLAHIECLEDNIPLDAALQDLEVFYKNAKQRFDQDEKFADRARQLVVLLQSGDAKCLELWQTFIELSLSHCQTIYNRLGVALQRENIKAESSYNNDLPKIIQILRDQNLLVTENGAQCVFLDGFKGKDQEPLPIIVQKKDGGFLYASTDLAALRYRQQVLNANRIIYVVDARQALHFQQVFTLAHTAGLVLPTTILEHVSFGMVLDKSGKPFKSRDGGVTKLADLLDEAERRAEALIASKQPDLPSNELKSMAKIISIAAVKYADLSKNRISDYVFDWDTMLSFEGNTAPYLLYAYTRINSLMTKAAINIHALENKLVLSDALDLKLAKQLVMFPEIIANAANKSTPHLLCTYLYELSGLFSSFYESCPILNHADESIKLSRLKLVALTARIIHQGLTLLGIPILTRM